MIPTILITALLAVIVVAIIAGEIRARKKGKCTCGGNCASCGGCCGINGSGNTNSRSFPNH
ncbi:MAG: FeoB-associated Cys-rich membrane protein [Eubacteriales bacterium]